MKRFIYTLFLVILVVGIFQISHASADVGTWTTGIDIQNLTGTGGTLVVQFYTSTGGDAGSLSDTIDAWGSLNYYLPSESAPPAGGTYSAVVSSDVQVAATVSNQNYTLGGADIYLGTDTPESIISFPLVYRNHTSGKWNTKISVQNTSSTSQNVVLKLYTAGETTPDYTSSPTSIQPYSYFTFNISESTYAAFGPYGSATVEGTDPLAGVALNTRDPGTGKINVIVSSYRAFGSGQVSQNIITPLVYKNYNLWTSGVNLFNTSGVTTTVTITYTNANPSIVGGPWVDTKALGPNAMDSFYTPSNTSLPNGYYGSAELNSSDTNIAVVVASQRYRPTGAEGVAYEGSKITDATACVSLPVVHNRTTWKTGINLLNLGDVTANITINYYSSAPGISDASKNYSIPAHSPLSIYMPTDASATALGFYGAADIKSTNSQPLLVNAAHSRADQGVGSNFVGINYTCP